MHHIVVLIAVYYIVRELCLACSEVGQMLSARRGLGLLEELCLSWDERRPGTGVPQECADRWSRGNCAHTLKLHQADWLLAPDLAKKEGKQDAAAYLCEVAHWAAKNSCWIAYNTWWVGQPISWLPTGNQPADSWSGMLCCAIARPCISGADFHSFFRKVNEWSLVLVTIPTMYPYSGQRFQDLDLHSLYILPKRASD